MKLDANLHVSEKSELVMDDDEEDVQKILQVLVLNHYQVAMLCWSLAFLPKSQKLEEVASEPLKKTGVRYFHTITTNNMH